MTRPARGRARGTGLAAVLLLALALLTPRLALGQTVEEARALARAGQLDEAVRAYTRVLDARPNDVEARMERARILGWLHRHADALADYDRVLALTPRDVDAILGRARALVRLDRIDEAREVLEKTATDYPDVADVHLALGAVALRQGRTDEALRAFARARELAPTDPAPLIGLGRARAAAGDAAGAAAARQEALAAFDRRLDAEPSDRDARVGRAQLLAGLGRTEEALADYDRVLAADPRDVEAMVGRVPLLLRQDRLDDAETAGRAAVARDPKSAEAWVTLGNVLTRQQRLDDAARAYEAARVIDPRAVEPVLGLARIRHRQEDLAAARAGYQEALRIDPRNEDAVDALGRIARAEEAGVARRFRLFLSGRYESLEGRSDWTQETVVLAMRPRPGTSLFVGIDQYHRNDRDDTQFSIGAGQALPGQLTLAASFAYTIDAETLAEAIYEVEVTRPLARWITPSLRFRWSDFVGDVYAMSLAPGVELTLAPQLVVLGRYFFTHSSDAGSGHAGSVRASLFPEGEWSFYGAVAYGRETYLADTVEDVVRGLERPDARHGRGLAHSRASRPPARL